MGSKIRAANMSNKFEEEVKMEQEGRGRSWKRKREDRRSSGANSPTLCNGVIVHCVGVLHCTVLYCTVLYFTTLYYIVLYYTVLYCTILHCTVLYCTTPYCIVLYYTVL